MAKKHTTIVFIATQVTLLLLSCYHPKRQDEERMTSSAVNMLQYEGFKVRYNIKTMQPDWVDYTLTAQQVELSKNTPKVPRHFMPDPALSLPQASQDDYSGSGWVRGHMARRQDMKWSEKAVRESDYFTNICPQNETMNNGVWHQIENLVRRVAQQYDSVHVICGPIFVDTSYGHIGQHHIPVPDYFFKTLLVKSIDGYHAIAFVCPNDAQHYSMIDVSCTVDSAEHISMMDVYAYLKDDIEALVESSVEYSIWGLN